MADWAAMVESRNAEILRLRGEVESLTAELEKAQKSRNTAVGTVGALKAELNRTADGGVDKVLAIVEEWCCEANDVGGVDATDLAFRLGRAGYSFPGGNRG